VKVLSKTTDIDKKVKTRNGDASAIEICGSITVTKAENSGSTFTATLPLILTEQNDYQINEQ